MHGQVYEWCADPWHDDYRNAPEVSRVWDEQNENDNYYQNIPEHLAELLEEDRARILRGGSWDIYPAYCRSAYRIRVNPGYRYLFYGFRVACGS